jgi:hypothetical protein
MASKVLDLRKGESINVIAKQNDFFEIKYKDKIVFVHERDIKPIATQHPIWKALTESSTTNLVTPNAKSTERRYLRGSRGGCYYVNSEGKKIYVDHSFCN